MPTRAHGAFCSSREENQRRGRIPDIRMPVVVATPALTFSHFGFFVRDIEHMADFYTRLLGFTVSDRGELDTPRGKMRFVFLTRDPREHHQIVLASGRPD